MRISASSFLSSINISTSLLTLLVLCALLAAKNDVPVRGVAGEGCGTVHFKV